MSSAALRALTAGAVAGAGVLAYAAGYEVHDFRLRRADVPVLPPGSPPLTVLHLSDLHLTPWQRAKQRWLEALSWLRPDLVVATGDLIAHRDAVRALPVALAGLMSRPGVFVHGSNDYFAPVLKSPLRYLLPDDGHRNADGPRLPTDQLDAALLRAGWLNLDNARGDLVLRGVRVHLVGTDDAHLNHDRYERVAGPPPPDAEVVLGVTHAPYLRVLDAMAADGVHLVLAGHTHGGQVCLPGGRALVTNCDLEPERARGLSRHPAGGGPESTWLHVSAGLGTSPTAPVRLACRPEATLLTLLPRPVQP